MGLTKVLHTDSTKFTGSYLKGSEERTSYNKAANITESYNRAYEYAREKELQFYGKFFKGVSSYEEFMAKLKELFNGASQDGKRIAQLGNLALSPLVDNDDVTLAQNLTYEIIFENDMAETILEKFETKTEDFIISSDRNVSINIDDAPSTAKQIASWIRYYDPVKKISKSNPGKFTEKATLTYVRQWMLKELEQTLVEAGETVIKEFGSTGIKLKVSNTNEKTTTKVLGDPVQIAVDFPLMTKKPSEIKQLLNDSETRVETMTTLTKIYGRFYKFLLKLLNNGSCIIEGNDILHQAFQKAWEKNAGTPEAFLDSLMVGNNLSAGLKGVLGELQADIIFEYLQITRQTTNPMLGEIIGGIAGGKRGQPRADYRILEELGASNEVGQLIAGIQVKNYSDSMMSSVDINTDLGLIAPNIGQGFTDTIVNAQFNKDIAAQAGTGAGSIDRFLKKYLEARFWEGMNLHINDDLDPSNTNTFYLVQGTMIVPASTIINTIRNTQKISNPKFSITGFQKPTMGDADFAMPEDRPEFIKYWRDNQYIEGSATEYNTSSYEGILLNTRIHTSFNMSAIIGANGGMENFRFF